MLEASLAYRSGNRAASFDLSIDDGEVLALVGPNGAGKSTAVDLLAGFVVPDAGQVRLADVVLEDTDAGIRVPPHQRHLGVMFQDLLLFPHLDVVDNVAFGLRSTGSSRRRARDLARQILDDAGLTALAARRPAQLSGGESQRVVLARTLAPSPRALILDEPLSALDAEARADVRRHLRDRVDDFSGPTLLVTHDPIDAFTLADRIAVMEDGALTQVGTVAEVSAAPRSAYAAALFGVTLLVGRSDGTTVRVAGTAVVAAHPMPVGPTLVVIRPDAVALHRSEPDSSARNRWPFRVDRLDHLGSRVRVGLSGPFDLTADVTPSALGELGIDIGSDVWASVKATEVATHVA